MYEAKKLLSHFGRYWFLNFIKKEVSEEFFEEIFIKTDCKLEVKSKGFKYTLYAAIKRLTNQSCNKEQS